MYKYFIAFTYQTDLGNTGTGSLVESVAQPVTTSEELRDLEEYIEENSNKGLKIVVITSLELIGEPEEPMTKYQEVLVNYNKEKARADLLGARLEIATTYIAQQIENIDEFRKAIKALHE